MNFVMLLILGSTWSFAQLTPPPFYQNSVDQLVYDFKNLNHSYGRYGAYCLWETGKCGLTPREIQILAAIVKNQPEETKNTRFNLVTGSKYPQIFNQGGAPRVAATDNARFSPIWFNVDLMIDLKTGVQMPMKQMISIFVHEMGHHEGVGDTEERTLDRIGNAVGESYSRNTLAMDLRSLGLPHVRAEFHNFTDHVRLRTVPQKSLRHAEAAWALGNGTMYFETDLPARIVTIIGKACNREDHVQQTHFSNLRWLNLPKTLQEGERVNLIARMKILCGPDVRTATEYEASFIAFAELTKRHGQWILNEARSGFDVITRDLSEERLQGTLSPVSTNVAALTNGGVWSGSTVATLDVDAPVTGCKAFFSADHFYKQLTNFSATIQMSGCTLVRSGTGKFQIKFHHTFPAKTFPAFYYLSAIQLSVKGKRDDLILNPPIRKGVQLSTPGYVKPSFAQATFVDANMRVYPRDGFSGFKPGDKYGVVAWFKNSAKPYDIQFAIRGLETKGKSIHNLLQLTNPNGRLSNRVVAELGVDQGMWFVKIMYQPYEDIREAKWMGFHYLDYMDENYAVIRINFPETYQVRP